MRRLPKYPIFIPSKGRWDRRQSKTINRLTRDRVPFYVVVEEGEREPYEKIAGEYGTVLTLPEGGGGSSMNARNWIMGHSIEMGAERHWQLDDNVREFRRLYRGERVPCSSAFALAAVEEFTDRYENIAISGLAYQGFINRNTVDPFYLNVHVYSLTLINNAIPHRWRLRYNEDTDICLQVLSDGWCTVLVTAFMGDKTQTMKMKGGNTDVLYKGDGRTVMARTLERMWPHAVSVDRRWGRAQHVVRDSWRKFDTPLKLKQDVDLGSMQRVDELGMELKQLRAIDGDDPRLTGIVDAYAETSERASARGAAAASPHSPDTKTGGDR